MICDLSHTKGKSEPARLGALSADFRSTRFSTSESSDQNLASPQVYGYSRRDSDRESIGWKGLKAVHEEHSVGPLL